MLPTGAACLRAACVGVLTLLVLLPALLLVAGGAHAQLPLPSPSAEPSPEPEPSEEPPPSPEPEPEPEPTREPDPTRTSSPRPATTAPRTATATPPAEPEEPSEDLADEPTDEDTSSPTASPSPVSPVPVTSLDPSAPTPAPEPSEVAVSRSSPGDRFDLLVRLVLGGAVLLGLAGVAGLYVTRESKTREI